MPLSAKQRADADAETERIRANKKLPAAAARHVFKAAHWTHQNGHPRCLTCGDEERIGGVCNGEPTKAEAEAWVEKERRSYKKLGMTSGYYVSDAGKILYNLDAEKEKAAMVEAARRGDSDAFVSARARWVALRESHHPHVIYWTEDLHPRDRLGRFTEVLAMLRKSPLGSSVRFPDGSYMTFKHGHFRMHKEPGKVSGRAVTAKKAVLLLPRETHVRKTRWNFEPLKEPPSLVPLKQYSALGSF